MKILSIIGVLFLLLIPISMMQAQEKLVPFPPKGDPVIVAQAKELLQNEFDEESEITIMSVESMAEIRP